MPYVACPSCGERGKIPPTLVGARIKCRKCGVAFNVAPPAARAPAAAGGEVATTVAAMPLVATPEPSGTGHEGIAVEGLDASAWSAAGDASSELLKAVAVAEPEPVPTPHDGAEAQPFEHHEPGAFKEYKLLCPRDKIFEGKFDLPRLEEVLNFYGRQGWIVKAMSTPHLKTFGDAVKEELVILLER